jgi:hypothetical protein
MPTPDIVGVAEIARWLGVSDRRVQQIIADPRHPFPAATELASGRIWDRADIAQWIAQYRPERLGHGPPASTV